MVKLNKINYKKPLEGGSRKGSDYHSNGCWLHWCIRDGKILFEFESASGTLREFSRKLPPPGRIWYFRCGPFNGDLKEDGLYLY